MDNNHDNIEGFERIEQYLNGELSPAERQRFEQQLQEDATLAAALENARTTRKAVQAYGLRKEIADIRTAMLQGEKATTARAKVKGLLYYGWRAAAAAVVLIAITVTYQYTTLSPSQLFEERSAPYVLRASRSGESPAKPGISTVYSTGDMQRTIQEFEQLKQPAPSDYFLAGNAYLQQGNGARAIPCFQKALQSPTLREDAEYYLALSYLRQNDLAMALPLFRQIRNNSAHPYHNRVDSWFYWKLQLLDRK